MGKKIPQKESLSSKDVNLIGGGAIFWGLIGTLSSLLPLLFTIMRVIKIGTSHEAYFALTYMFMQLFTFVGLLIIGLFVIYQSRYVLFVLIPFSIIGLMSFPFGTVFYLFLLKGLWKFIPLYYPFDRKQRFSREDKADDS